MDYFSKSESLMWAKPIKEPKDSSTDSEINEKYSAGEHRIVTETNREKIPNFVRALDDAEYMKLRPFYQRRARWTPERQSLLIESFIMNIPVPPLFLYENDFNKYEVMDGQQRITALQSFYRGEYKLTGLKVWKELNGRTYSSLPSQIRSGLDRRAISYIVVLRESTPKEDDALFLRQTVFERLNTGGVKLENQEIRNCLYQSKFNNLLNELSKNELFRSAFGLPSYTKEEELITDTNSSQSAIFEKMEDVENVLRFFALRHYDNYTRGMNGFLDLYMARAMVFDEDDIEYLREIFNDTIEIAHSIYKEMLFKPFDINSNDWKTKPQRAYYDSVMVATSNMLHAKNKLLKSREKIIEATKQMFISSPDGTFTGRGNTKGDIQRRIALFTQMLQQHT